VFQFRTKNFCYQLCVDRISFGSRMVQYDLITGTTKKRKNVSSINIANGNCWNWKITKKCGRKGNVNELPNELLEHIFQFLGYKDVLHLGRVCKSWKEDFRSSDSLWRYICKRDYPLLSTTMEDNQKSASWYAHYKWCYKFRVLIITTEKESPGELKMKDVKSTIVKSGLVCDKQISYQCVNLQTDGLSVEASMHPIFPTMQLDAQVYNCALFYGHCLEFSSDNIVGDLLADYVDQGGGLVVCPFVNIIPFHLGGRWKDDGYSPLQAASGCIKPKLSLGRVLNPLHPIMRGVHSLFSGESFTGIGIPSTNADLIAEWDNGAPLLACSLTKKVVALNLYPPSSNVKKMYWDHQSDGTALIGNALLYVAN